MTDVGGTVRPMSGWQDPTGIVVFGERALATRVLGALSNHDAVFQHDAPGPDRARGAAVVIACMDRGSRAAWAELERTRRRILPGRFVVVATLAGESVTFLAGLPQLLRCTVWDDQLPAGLFRRLEAMQEHLLCRVARWITGAPDTSAVMRGVIRQVWGAQVPPTSVGRLAKLAGVGGSTLRHHVQMRFGGKTTPKQLIDWGLVVHASQLCQDRSVSNVGFRLGVHPRTLQRASVRTLGVGLRRIGQGGSAWLECRFAEWVSSRTGLCFPLRGTLP